MASMEVKSGSPCRMSLLWFAWNKVQHILACSKMIEVNQLDTSSLSKMEASLLCIVKICGFFDEKWLAFRVLKHKSCTKIGLRSILTAFHGFLTSIAFEIITLLTSSKSVIVKKKKHSQTFHFIWARSMVCKSDISLFKAQEILMECFLSVRSWKSVIPSTSLFWIRLASWLLTQGVFEKQLFKLFWGAPPCIYKLALCIIFSRDLPLLRFNFFRRSEFLFAHSVGLFRAANSRRYTGRQ